MTTLYINYPARAAAADTGAACTYAQVGDGGNLMQQGAGALARLGDLVAASGKVVLLLAAADVTLLRVAVPPLSGSRLKAAIPNLVEEQLLGDPDDCVFALGPTQPGSSERTVAVVQRAWLDVLVKALVQQGARAVSALPAQLCLPLAPGGVSASLASDEGGIELTLRTGPYEGLGLALPAQPDGALQVLRALAGEAPVTLYVPAAQRAHYEALLASVSGITLEEDHWAHRIAAGKAVQLDLAAGLGAASGARAQAWKRWRWPLRLALLALLVNIVGLNVEWLRMKREAEALRLSMVQIFRGAYPNEKVVLDPAAQLRANLARAKAGGGETARDDFTALAAAFGEALGALPRRDVVAGLEYRERALVVRLKPNSVDGAALAKVQAQLAPRGLALTETGAGTWELRTGGKS
ncbi:type II secretion system protein GspL [Pseudoduganella umbonata]|uniref:General secretion pathway protein GspL n=1 Tax=Pseudoduganella umbonata TaxID=864828 RepID=A0A4P8HSK5_9BURK|nr:type II secretion system protein GspL [Pseudoduganella umbonata]MBB3223733.1 general secretion pathway protein L [Pseudoduganella umbonata]QCP12839.1 general secretion pathway protein GspL [Pseudoduganella umbonata]